MPQVEFHILSEAGEVPRLRYACQLIEQASKQGQRSYVFAADDEQAKRMDEMLWTFRDQAFIPHEVLNSTSPSHPRIVAVIGASLNAPAEFQSLMINLCDAMPESLGNFTRICEVVDADAQHKQLARDRYRLYRNQGCQLETINQ
jgi:DNA polymerase-3 subunit chi